MEDREYDYYHCTREGPRKPYGSNNDIPKELRRERDLLKKLAFLPSGRLAAQVTDADILDPLAPDAYALDPSSFVDSKKPFRVLPIARKSELELIFTDVHLHGGTGHALVRSGAPYVDGEKPEALESERVRALRQGLPEVHVEDKEVGWNAVKRNWYTGRVGLPHLRVGISRESFEEFVKRCALCIARKNAPRHASSVPQSTSTSSSTSTHSTYPALSHQTSTSADEPTLIALARPLSPSTPLPFPPGAGRVVYVTAPVHSTVPRPVSVHSTTSTHSTSRPPSPSAPHGLFMTPLSGGPGGAAAAEYDDFDHRSRSTSPGGSKRKRAPEGKSGAGRARKRSSSGTRSVGGGQEGGDGEGEEGGGTATGWFNVDDQVLVRIHPPPASSSSSSTPSHHNTSPLSSLPILRPATILRVHQSHSQSHIPRVPTWPSLKNTQPMRPLTRLETPKVTVTYDLVVDDGVDSVVTNVPHGDIFKREEAYSHVVMEGNAGWSHGNGQGSGGGNARGNGLPRVASAPDVARFQRGGQHGGAVPVRPRNLTAAVHGFGGTGTGAGTDTSTGAGAGAGAIRQMTFDPTAALAGLLQSATLAGGASPVLGVPPAAHPYQPAVSLSSLFGSLLATTSSAASGAAGTFAALTSTAPFAPLPTRPPPPPEPLPPQPPPFQDPLTALITSGHLSTAQALQLIIAQQQHRLRIASEHLARGMPAAAVPMPRGMEGNPLAGLFFPTVATVDVTGGGTVGHSVVWDQPTAAENEWNAMGMDGAVSAALQQSGCDVFLSGGDHAGGQDHMQHGGCDADGGQRRDSIMEFTRGVISSTSSPHLPPTATDDVDMVDYDAPRVDLHYPSMLDDNHSHSPFMDLLRANPALYGPGLLPPGTFRRPSYDRRVSSSQGADSMSQIAREFLNESHEDGDDVTISTPEMSGDNGSVSNGSVGGTAGGTNEGSPMSGRRGSVGSSSGSESAGEGGLRMTPLKRWGGAAKGE